MRKQMITLFAVIGALMLGLGIVLFVVFVIVYPAPGNAIATVDARLNEPFSLRYVSQGTKERVWIDLDCVGCENTLSASIDVSVNGTKLESHELERACDGYARSHEERGDRHILKGQLLFAVNAQPRGATVQLDGVFHVRPTTVWVLPPGEWRPADPPTVTALRVWVAR